jgi:hypothetical protein
MCLAESQGDFVVAPGRGRFPMFQATVLTYRRALARPTNGSGIGGAEGHKGREPGRLDPDHRIWVVGICKELWLIFPAFIRM